MATQIGVMLDPEGEENAEKNSIAKRLGSLEGKTVGILDNCKKNADIFLDEVGMHLREEYRVAEVISRRKDKASMPAGAMITDLVEECDAVVNAYGDCGSCTSWTVHDSVEMEMQGIPTATVESEEFTKLAQSETDALGMPGMPLVTVPHPMGGVDKETIRKRAADSIPEIERLLTSNNGDLESEFDGQFLGEDEELTDRNLSCPL